MKNATPAPTILNSADFVWIPDEIKSGDSSIVQIALDSESKPIAVEKPKNPDCAVLIHREAAILTALKHPLVLELRAQIPGHIPSLVTEYAGNGSLASLLAADGQHRFCSPNQRAKIIAGIALAMRFAHSRGAIRRGLNPANILLAWDWTVRIADLGHSVLPDIPPLIRPDAPRYWPSVDFRYLVPEGYDGTFCCATDVFAFGLILFEVLAGRPAFPVNLEQWQITFLVVVMHTRPEIPESVPAPARELIADCWAPDPDNRPTFEEIVDRLAEMQFRVTAHVNSAKVEKFAKQITEREKQNGGE